MRKIMQHSKINDDYVVKNLDGAPPYAESDASDSEADGNENNLISFWKSSLILLLKPTFITFVFVYLILIQSFNLKE